MNHCDMEFKMAPFSVRVDGTTVENYASQPLYIKALWSDYKLNTNTITYGFDRYNQDFEWSVQVSSLDGQGVTATNVEDAVAKFTSRDGIFAAPGVDVDVIDITTTFYHHVVIDAYNLLQRYTDLTIREAASGERPTSIIAAVDSTNPIVHNGKLITGLSSTPNEVASGSTVTILPVKASGSDERTTPDGGSYPLERAMHEIFHSLGLKHPHDGAPLLPARLDFNYYTVMSYNKVGELTANVANHFDVISGSVTGAGNAQTPMALDIYALQTLYGQSANAGGDTAYKWIADGQNLDLDPNDNQTVKIGRGFYSIWDTGGMGDAIDFSSASDRSLINLNGATLGEGAVREELLNTLQHSHVWNSMIWDVTGAFLVDEFNNEYAGVGGYLSTTFSHKGFRPGGFTIANPNGNTSAVIENAVGGSNDDIVIGNQAANEIRGNDGDDFIFGFNGDDVIFGGSGNDELRGGTGADRIHGGSGDDLIYYAKDGDIVDGGDGDDVFVYDGLVQSAWGDATIIGGAGNDTLYLDSSDYGSGSFFDFIMDSSYNGIRWQDIETVNVGWARNLDGTWSQGGGYTFNGSVLFEEGFTGANASLNDFLGSSQNSNFTSVSKATVIDGGSDSTIFQGATTGVIGDVTGVRGSFFWNGQTVALNVSYATGQLTASLPTGFEFNLDDLNYGHARINAAFEVDYRWVDSYESGGTFYEVEYNETLYRSAGIGVFNAYDHGLTALVSDAVVLATHNALPSEILVTNDSHETLRPVRYSLVDDHGGAFTIHESDGYISLVKPGLFPDGQDIVIRIRAEDGVSSVDKDMTIRMDQSVEVAPTISSTTVSHPVIGRAGELVGWQAVYDANEQLSGTDASHIDLVVSGQAGDKPLLEYALGTWNVVLARDPLAAEIGVPLTATLTVRDSTGQTAVSNFTFTLEPLVKTINGTNGADYLETGSDSTRPWVINGLDGDDTIYGYLDGTVLNGGAGDDMIYLYGSNGIVNGGDGSDRIEVVANDTVLNGGAGTDTFVFYGGERSKIVYGSLSDSALDNAVLNEGAPPEVDVIWNFGDTDTIDLSALGEIEWKGQSTSSTSMLAEFIADENGSAFFLLDSDRDADYDFGIEFASIQATSNIHFMGLDPWLL